MACDGTGGGCQPLHLHLPHPPVSDPKSLRRTLRAARRALTADEQHRHGLRLAARLGTPMPLRAARRIALYLPADGEIDTAPLIARLRRLKRRCFLPVLRGAPHYSLWFAEFRPGDKLIPNRFRIPEPSLRHRKPVAAWGLDLILLPLVGFDETGNRLGMGGGYYDRTLAFLRRRRHWQRPRLIGLAHDCQRVARIDANPWDIPLDGVATETRLYRWKRGDSPPISNQSTQ